jgi:hypothetical protein
MQEKGVVEDGRGISNIKCKACIERTVLKPEQLNHA